MPIGGLPGMPPQPSQDDIDTTCVTPLPPVVRPLAAASTRLTYIRWSYLQHGVTRIMMNLQEGIDLQTVCGRPLRLRLAGLRDPLTLQTVHGHLHVSFRPAPPCCRRQRELTCVSQGRPQLLHIPKSRQLHPHPPSHRLLPAWWFVPLLRTPALPLGQHPLT